MALDKSYTREAEGTGWGFPVGLQGPPPSLPLHPNFDGLPTPAPPALTPTLSHIPYRGVRGLAKHRTGTQP